MEYSRIKEVNERLKPMIIERKDKKTGKVTQKDYNTVDQRILGFRELFPNGAIQTEIVSFEGDSILMKATAFDDDGKIIATGHAHEKQNASYINETSFVENCETSAIGRCIGNIGIGLTEGLASLEEIQAAEEAQEKAKAESVQKALNDLRNMYEKNGGKEWDKWLKEIAPDGMTNEIYGREMARLKKEITDKAEQTKGKEKA